MKIKNNVSYENNESKKISDLIVLNSLKNISYGRIEFINYDGDVTLLGSNDASKTATLKLNKPGVTFEIINKGSVGLADTHTHERRHRDRQPNGLN